MLRKYTYSKQIPFKKVGTGLEYIDDDRVEEGKVLILQSISIIDKTSALAYIRIGKVSGGAFILWEEQKNVAAGELIFTQEEHRIGNTEYFRAELKGGASGDVCEANLDGYRCDVEEE